MLGFHRPGRLDVIDDVDHDILASERVDELREAVKAWCRDGGPVRLGPAQPGRPAAQPRRARGAPHRTAPGPPRHEPRATFRVDELAAAMPADSVPLDQRRRRRRDHPRRARREVVKGSAYLEEELVRPALPDLARRLLPDQHGDGRAPLRRRRRARRADRARARARPVLRDRHDRAGAGARRRRGAGAWRSSRRRWPTRSRTPALNGVDNAQLLRRRRAHWRCGRCWSESGKPDVVVVDPPRAGLSQKVVRRVLEAEARADRLRVVQPHDAGAERAPDGGRGLRAEDGPPGRHVPADPAHRVRRRLLAALTALAAPALPSGPGGAEEAARGGDRAGRVPAGRHPAAMQRRRSSSPAERASAWAVHAPPWRCRLQQVPHPASDRRTHFAEPVTETAWLPARALARAYPVPAALCTCADRGLGHRHAARDDGARHGLRSAARDSGSRLPHASGLPSPRQREERLPHACRPTLAAPHATCATRCCRSGQARRGRAVVARCATCVPARFATFPPTMRSRRACARRAARRRRRGRRSRWRGTVQR